jgi:RNA polymerase sigma factor (sigma-70 family)
MRHYLVVGTEGAGGDLDPIQIEDFLRNGYARVVDRTGLRFRGEADAEDAVQEAVIRAWERLSSERIVCVPAWVTTVATNLARSELRKRRSEQAALARLYWCGREGLVEEEPSDGVELHADVSRVIAQLPERERQVVILFYYGDLPVRDIAGVLDVKDGTVKEALHRARRRLANDLGAFGATRREDRRTRRPVSRVATGRRTMKGWYMSGSHPGDYEHGIAEVEKHEGHRVAYLRSHVEAPSGFGTLMQMVAAEEFRGKRIRLSGELKAKDIEGWAGLWMRVDGQERKTTLAFDNMQDRAVTGTTEWNRHSVVLDVAEDAAAIGIGTLLSGRGEVRIADLRFEPVPTDVPTTGHEGGRGYPSRPQNLSFADD